MLKIIRFYSMGLFR